MTREEKDQMIDSLAETLKSSNTVYLTDISKLNSSNSTRLRSLCFKRNVTLQVVKNTLLKKAMEKSEKNFEGLFGILHGPTSLMISDSGNVPAKLIKEFRKTSDKPILKGAYVQEMVFVGDDQLDLLMALKSKNELIADVLALLQSPVKNVISGLQSGGHKLSGILKTLSEKEA
ncbi:MAG: 50S ribosomal protein L10 [Bacteroidales bacterium]|nr:50S ribosomal protein L10 [Bacteroidales bacterium]